MALDNNYDSAKEKIDSFKTYIQVFSGSKSLKLPASDMTADAKKNVVSQVDKLKEAITGGTANIKKFQKKFKNQFEELLDIFSLNAGNGSDTTSYLKKRMILVWRRTTPEIGRILIDESFKAMGCSQDQVYTPGTPLKIKLKSIDLFDMLKESPDSEVGKVSYEKTPIQYGTYPFSMNRELFERIKSSPNPMTTPGTSYVVNVGSPYRGKSGQNLFDIKYVPLSPNYGPYFEVTLQNRITGNSVKEFLYDYYSTINIIDTTNLFANLMNRLTGCLDIQLNVSDGKISADERVGLIIQRILGLCFDSNQEIDVAGTSKLAEDDGIDNSFFEFNEIDYRIIDERINDRRNGVVEFEDCDNLKLPVDYGSIYDNLLNIETITNNTEDKQNEIIDQLIDSFINNPNWNIPVGLDLKIKVNLNFIKDLPKALIYAILSPKILLPIMVILKSLGQSITDLINNVEDFMKNFKTFFINLVSKIASIFVRELFEIIKQDILKLIKSIALDIKQDQLLKKYAIIFTLIEVIQSISKIINDWRQCKGVLDSLLDLLNVSSASSGVIQGLAGGQVPLPLLAGSQFLPGYSKTRATVNVIEQMQKSGIPTGPNPDGSPNMAVIFASSIVEGSERERDQNGKVEVFAQPIQVIGGQYTNIVKLHGKPL